MQRERLILFTAALASVALPFAFAYAGLPSRAASDVVIFALAGMGVNVLAGGGLISFGHGVWFGLAAYAAALTQRHWFPGDMILPAACSFLFVAIAAWPVGALIARGGRAYFALSTLALAALVQVLALRWEGLTGGASGLDVARPILLGVDFAREDIFYWLVAAVGLAASYVVMRFQRSPAGRVLSAIRENEQRARVLGYPVDRYKRIAFVLSAGIVATAGILWAFGNRSVTPEPLSVAFSGLLVAVAAIGGMRSLAGPALGALFLVLFREAASPWTPHWLSLFAVLFVAFVIFLPRGIAGVLHAVARAMRPRRRRAQSKPKAANGEAGALPLWLKGAGGGHATLLVARGLAKHFAGLPAVDRCDLTVRDRTLHALIGSNGAGKSTVLNLLSGLERPDAGQIELLGHSIGGTKPERAAAAGIGRSFQCANLFGGLSVFENVRLARQARHRKRLAVWATARSTSDLDAETADMIAFCGLSGSESTLAAALPSGKQRLLDIALALASRPRLLLLDEPCSGLSQAERVRLAALIKMISAEIAILLAVHESDHLWQEADTVTVMERGRVAMSGPRDEVYRRAWAGAPAGMAALAAQPRQSAAGASPILCVRNLAVFHGESRVLDSISFDVNDHEILAVLGRNGSGKSSLLTSLMGLVAPRLGSVLLAGEETGKLSPPSVARAGLAYVPQGGALFTGMTVADNLALGRFERQTGAGVHWDEDRIFWFFPRLRNRLNARVSDLSRDERRIVALARALAGDVRVLLIDEPFEALSPAATEDMFEALDKLRYDVAVVVADNRPDLVLALADRALVLENGAAIWRGAASRLRDDPELRQKMLWAR